MRHGSKILAWLPLEDGKKLGLMKDIPAKEGMQRDLQAAQGNSTLHDTPGNSNGESQPLLTGPVHHQKHHVKEFNKGKEDVEEQCMESPLAQGNSGKHGGALPFEGTSLVLWHIQGASQQSLYLELHSKS